MNAPIATPRPKYFVLSGCYRAEFVTFAEAVAWRKAQGGEVVGDGYDCDCDDTGFYVCSDGLTDAERAQLEEA